MSTIDNINGIYAKDTELRNGISELRGDILSQTIKPLNVTKNGTYTADPTVGAYGYSPITVDVQEEPWQPLEDGYSNFWFELTNDTLSPWLNFSAKNNDAVIDWGDGSGEVALDTLSPTHTYSKAGKYVVKVKGVTGIAEQQLPPFSSDYLNVLRAVELNADVTSLATRAFARLSSLKNADMSNSNATGSVYYGFSGDAALKSVSLPNGITSLSSSFYNCASLNAPVIPSTVTSLLTAFYQCLSIAAITLPSSVANIGANTFSGCSTLSEVHVQATQPPTIGSNAFNALPSNWVCYVPVGYGDTYKAASGWSDYADHILEEGQTPTRAMLSKFENTKKSDNIEIEETR